MSATDIIDFVTGDQDVLTKLAEEVRARREWLRMTIEEAAAAGGISDNTWGRVEKAGNVRGLTYAGIDRALRWAPGSCRAILNGQPPEPLGDPVPVAVELTPIHARLHAILTKPDTTPELRAQVEALLTAITDMAEGQRQAERPTA